MSDRRPFQLLIKPVGADCNLRCDYCFYLRAHELYEDKGRHVMGLDVQERMIENLMKLRFPQSVFAWQGGEPTLAGVDFFRHAVELQKKHGGSGQSVSNSLQTNGILIDEDWCRLFREYHFLIGLSIDGPQHIHDRIRRSPSGRGTWDKAMESARLMERNQVEFNILCVINAGNVKLGADLPRWFVSQGFNYLQFIPCLEPGMAHNVTPDDYADFLIDCFDYWAKDGFGTVSVRDFDAMLSVHMGFPEGLCIFGKKCNHYIVVEHTGDIYPCDFFVYGEWKLGNLMEAPLESFMETEKYKQFAAQKYKVPACSGCPWRNICFGGCQKDRRLTGLVAGPSPLCPAYKKFFAHAVPQLDALAKRVRRNMPRASE